MKNCSDVCCLSSASQFRISCSWLPQRRCSCECRSRNIMPAGFLPRLWHCIVCSCLHYHQRFYPCMRMAALADGVLINSSPCLLPSIGSAEEGGEAEDGTTWYASLFVIERPSAVRLPQGSSSKTSACIFLTLLLSFFYRQCNAGVRTCISTRWESPIICSISMLPAFSRFCRLGSDLATAV